MRNYFVPFLLFCHFGVKTFGNNLGNNYFRTQTKDNIMKKFSSWLIVILILVVIGATMTMTCPDTQAHKDKLSQMVSTSVKETLSSEVNNTNTDILTQGLQMVGGIVLNKVVDGVIDNMLHVDNHVVCSIGKVEYSGEEHIVSVGLLGHIFTVNQDKLNEATKKYYQKLQQETIGNVGDKVREAIEPYANKVVEGIVNGIGDVIRDALSDEEPAEDGQSSH